MKVIIAGGSGFMGSHFVQYMAGKYPENQIITFICNPPFYLIVDRLTVDAIHGISKEYNSRKMAYV